MSATTSIEWTERTWNPLRGCSVVSPGCVNCYAMKTAHRFSGPGKPFEGLTKQTKAGPQWTGKVVTVEDALLEPLAWKKPQRVFVNSMSDLFHEDVPLSFIDKVFAVMALTPRHTFQILTKRADRMLKYFESFRHSSAIDRGFNVCAWADSKNLLGNIEKIRQIERGLPNVWLGVSVEDQQRADERIPLLLQTPAAVRFISAEPLLGPVGLHTITQEPGDSYGDGGIYLDALTGERWMRDGFEKEQPKYPALDWCIVGGESGPGARPCATEWLERIVEQCRLASVPVFVKQLGAYVVSEERTAPADMMRDPARALREFQAPNGEVWAWRMGTVHRKGGDPSEWPVDLRVREWPGAQS